MRRANHLSGFTLVELLVVITIITVLLALLMPALDLAVYQAELAVCSANQHGLGLGVTSYAMEARRRYPHRKAVHEQQQWPMNVSWGQPENDDRWKLKPYMALNATLNCPMSPQVDIEGSDADTAVFAAYNLWFGFQFRDKAGSYAGMLRLGDRLGYEDKFYGDRLSVPLLASTRYIPQGNNAANFVSASHPGNSGDYFSVVRQDSGVTSMLGATLPGAKYTFMRWDSSNPDRGLMELNAVFADLAVQRYEQVHWDPKQDERMARVPAYSNSAAFPNTWWETVPRR